MTEVSARIARLFAYPVKSCAGAELTEALVTETGFDLDRAWMVVDESGEFVTQRELPRMALVKTQFRRGEVILRAPGMLALHLQEDAVEGPAQVRVWNDTVAAYDMGDVAAQWFSDFLGRKSRLARFDPECRRLSNLEWTGGVEAPNQFADGYPLLVVSEASLDLLNEKLAARGVAAIGIERFRPNIVLAGLEAHDEDRVSVLRIDTPEGEVRLALVKPCSRCTIPTVDPATAEMNPAINDVLRTYRASERLGGAIAFAMNAIVLEGFDRILRAGQRVTGDWDFA
ncbi:MAG TPA: MOSC N-terminal beta barrel domain-containing protein [Ramlibacter sp.]|uniref:MOSC domain-containing protein n=1 Tax=Ramlibacter sp. TaxID=1917967 RepID=UPI002C2E584F|nr:MOSC N-terminal beta barrel domain-containing protein [Ramlibacter sp.]HVZ45532.1 MOSC N-terminal beta barrel domain-containing protein [Ramlibacter sp.]